MNQQLLTPLIATAVTVLLKLWNTPIIRDKAFSFIPRLPKAVQWIAPLTLGILAAAGQGFLEGKRYEELVVFATSNGAEIGALAIAIWHVGKRVLTESKTTAALMLMFAVSFTNVGCKNLRPAIDKVVIFEQQVHSEAVNLQVAAYAVIPLLPPAQQDVARAQLARAFEKMTMLLQIKDNAVQAAIEASEKEVNISALVLPVVAAIEEIILLVKSFGSNTTTIEGRALQMRHSMGVK